MHQRPTDPAPLPHGVDGKTVDLEDVLVRRHRDGWVQAYVTRTRPPSSATRTSQRAVSGSKKGAVGSGAGPGDTSGVQVAKSIGSSAASFSGRA